MTANSVATPAAAVATRVDGSLLGELRRFGAADVSACFSCGVCTATCPLVTDDGTFPRRIIRYAQLGLRDKLLNSRELWTCYACGQCSEQCPQEAEPSQFMASARRYAIASYDRTHLSATLATRPIAGSLIAILLAVLLGAFMWSGTTAPRARSRWTCSGSSRLRSSTTSASWSWRSCSSPGSWASRAWPAASREPPASAGVTSPSGGRPCGARLARRGRRSPSRRSRRSVIAASARPTSGPGTAGAGSSTRRRCGASSGSSGRRSWTTAGGRRDQADRDGRADLVSRPAPGHRRRAGTHVRHHVPGPAPPAWGGAIAAELNRRGLALPGAALDRRHDGLRPGARAVPARGPGWGYAVFLVHVAVAMELVLLAPFMKLAHAVYRPVAMFFLALATTQAASAGEGPR